MAWDLHWATSPAGPISDATWVGKIIAYIKTVPNASRFIDRHAALRLRLAAGRAGHAARVGRHDRAAGVARAPRRSGTPSPRSRTSPTRTPRGVTHTAYFATAQSVQGRLGQARAAGLGVGLWRLGDEDQETWNIPSLNLVKRLGDILAATLLAQPARRLLPVARGHRLVHQELVPAGALARPGVRALQPLRDRLPALALQPLAALPPRAPRARTSCRRSPS